LESIKIATILSVPFCPYHFVRSPCVRYCYFKIQTSLSCCQVLVLLQATQTQVTGKDTNANTAYMKVSQSFLKCALYKCKPVRELLFLQPINFEFIGLLGGGVFVTIMNSFTPFFKVIVRYNKFSITVNGEKDIYWRWIITP